MALKLKRLQLTNFCQFTSLDIDLSSDTVVIVGRNGSGKSTVLEALYYAITGEIRTGSKADCLTDLPTNKATKGYVELWFSFNNVDGYIKRTLHGTAASFTYGDTSLTSNSAINDFMTNIIGVTRKTFSRYCCVAQGETEAIISDQPAVRSEAFAELFGAQQCKRIYDLLGKEEALNPTTDYMTFITDSRTKILTSESQLASIDEQLSANTDARTSLGVITDLRDIIRRYDAGAALITVSQQYRVTYETQRKTLADLTSEINDCAAKLAEINNRLAMLKADADSAAIALTRLDEINTLQVMKKSLIARGDQLTADISTVSADITALEQPLEPVAETTVREAEATLQSYKSIVAQFKSFKRDGDKLVCPTCKQPISADDVKAAEDYIKVNESAINELRRIRDGYLKNKMAYSAAIIAGNRRTESLKAELRETTASLESVTARLNDVAGGQECDRTALQYKIDAYNSTLSEHKLFTALMKELTTRRDDVAMAYKTTESQITAVEAKINAMPTKQEYDAACESVQIFDVLSEEVNRLTIEKTALERELSSLRTNLIKLEDEQDKIDKLRSYCAMMHSARAVMHYDGLPKVRAKTFLASINERLNYYLDQFESNFSATLGEDYVFTCMFSDGKSQPASRLSGGEKVRLSLAFRFAVNELFAKNLGLLILDEPTVFLDSANIAKLSEVVELLRTTVKNAEMQVIVVTHEEELKGHFDKCVTLAGNVNNT